jgi:hypothetical protein
MSNNLSSRLLSDLEDFRQQALRCVNDATFILNNLRGKSTSKIFQVLNSKKYDYAI